MPSVDMSQQHREGPTVPEPGQRQQSHDSTVTVEEGLPPRGCLEHSPKSLVQMARSTSVSLQGRQGAVGRTGHVWVWAVTHSIL